MKPGGGPAGGQHTKQRPTLPWEGPATRRAVRTHQARPSVEPWQTREPAACTPRHTSQSRTSPCRYHPAQPSERAAPPRAPLNSLPHQRRKRAAAAAATAAAAAARQRLPDLHRRLACSAPRWPHAAPRRPRRPVRARGSQRCLDVVEDGLQAVMTRHAQAEARQAEAAPQGCRHRRAALWQCSLPGPLLAAWPTGSAAPECCCCYAQRWHKPSNAQQAGAQSQPLPLPLLRPAGPPQPLCPASRPPSRR
jgi:hypothetical protein